MDLTINIAHRTCLRHLRDGATLQRLVELGLGHLLPELVDAGLVTTRPGDGAPVYVPSGVGVEYLRIMDEPTRRTERPARRPVPHPWLLVDATTAVHASGHSFELPAPGEGRDELEELYRLARDTADLMAWALEGDGL